jgi:periplasmic protein CpxP/Spy
MILKGFYMHTSYSKGVLARRSLASLLAAGSLVALAAYAQAPNPAAPAGPQMHSAEHMAKAMDHRISRMIKAVDGTPEQKDRLMKLSQAAMVDMKPLREQQMAARKKGMELLAAPSVDRNALEQLRAQQTTLHDAMSKRMTQHLADAAEVLTPAQRTKLAERMKQRGEHAGMHGGMHGMRGGHGRGGDMGMGMGMGMGQK